MMERRSGLVEYRICYRSIQMVLLNPRAYSADRIRELFSKEIKGVELPDVSFFFTVRLGRLPVHRRVAVRRVSLDRPARSCLVLRLPGPLPEGGSFRLGGLLLFLVLRHPVRRPAGRDRRILHFSPPRFGLPPHRSMVPLQGASRGAVRPDRRGGAFPGGRPGGGE